MEDLKEIYERISFLRQKGIKMKEMAEQAGISPSVLSAIYSTVLPAYLKKHRKRRK
jgi:lambda repressor-like predicted transcriptional regulator